MDKTEKFIEKANKKHDNKFNYNKVVYEDTHTKIIITCPMHGDFKQQPRSHLKSMFGCIKCSLINEGDLSIRYANFIKKAHKIHGDTYDYSETKFEGSLKPISIICKKHGKFTLRSPTRHTGCNKQGCPKCATEIRRINERPKLLANFIKKSKKVHGDRYDYSKVDYINAHSPVIIVCKTHGAFIQWPLVHTNQKSGCPLCARAGSVSLVSSEWLDSLKLHELQREVNLKLDESYSVRVDGYDPTTNTVYEFMGDWWHGNPKFFDANEVHPVSKKTYGRLYLETLRRNSKIKDAGFDLVVMWENEWVKESGITPSKRKCTVGEFVTKRKQFSSKELKRMPDSRKKASYKKSMHYYIGECIHGHNVPRLTSTGCCLECNAIWARKGRAKKLAQQ